MEYKSISAKVSREESTLINDYCEKKGVTTSSFIRDLLLKEIEIPVPHNIAGKNRIKYNKEKDNFVWSVELDSGEAIEILRDVSPSYLEDLDVTIAEALKQRETFLGKIKNGSVSVPSNILRRGK